MVKYVDSGMGDDAAGHVGGGKKRKEKKGFKVDRRENFMRMMARKATGKASNARDNGPTHVKSVVFDDKSRKEYLLTLHKKKNERRVQAFVDAKRKHRKESAKTRREQREEARRAYNSYARVPILPNYTYRIPNFVEGEQAQEDEDDGNVLDDDGDESVTGSDARLAAAGDVCCDAGERQTGSAAVVNTSRRAEQRRLMTEARSVHAMPQAMLHSGTVQHTGEVTDPHDSVTDDDIAEADCVTVEVRPLFASTITSTALDALQAVETRAPAAGRRGHGVRGLPSAPLPSHDFSDLPAIVEEELRRLRQETKGPARTRPKVHMMKELEKIRKIRKHSRKGHGKKTTSGKRKNRKK